LRRKRRGVRKEARKGEKVGEEGAAGLRRVKN